VQLAKLTTDFQTLTDDMRKRFSVDGRSVLDEVYGTSPSFAATLSPLRAMMAGHPGSRSTGGAARGMGGRYSGRHMGGAPAAAAGGASGYPPFPGEFGSPGRDALLSTSAPVRGSSPITINQHRSKGVRGGGVAGSTGAAAAAAAGGVAGSSSSCGVRGSPSAAHSPSSSVAAAAGSTLAPSSLLSSEGNSSIPGSVDSGSGAAAMAAAAAAADSGIGPVQQQRGLGGVMPPLGAPAGSGGGAGSSSGGSFAAKGNGLLGQQLRNSSRAGSNGSLQGMEGVVAAPAGPPAMAEHASRLSATGLDVGAVLAGDPASLALLRRLQDQMEVVSEGFKRHSGMQLHLDALTHQYKHLNESMAALSAATKSLSECVQQLQQQGAVQQPNLQQRQQQDSKPGPQGGAVQWLQGHDMLGSAVLVAAGIAAGSVAALLLSRRQ